MTTGYAGYSDRCQWQISQLVLNLQELTTCDESESNLMSNNMGLSLMSATNHGLKCQSQNRLQPCHEKSVKNSRKEASALQLQLFSQSTVDEQKDMMTVLADKKQIEYDMKVRLAETKKTHKLSSGLQNQGLFQVLVGNENDIVVNGKEPPLHCKFCNDDHRFACCKKREEIKESATEYLLSIDTP